MSDLIRSVSYGHVKVTDKPGEAAEVLGALKKAKVNMLAFSGFPIGGKQAQLDFVTDNVAKLKTVCKSKKWKLSPIKKAFLVQGRDRVGAVSGVVEKLSKSKINITAMDAVTAGKGRYGVIMWVKPKAYTKAKTILGAK